MIARIRAAGLVQPAERAVHPDRQIQQHQRELVAQVVGPQRGRAPQVDRHHRGQVVEQISTVTTNVPGPRTPLTCVGRPVRQLLPVVPIADRVRIGFAVLSYCDRLAFGITADGTSTPDVDVLAASVADAWRSVLTA